MKTICHCQGIDDEIIISKIKQGYITVEAIQEETTAGTGCGGCISDIKKLIEEYKK